MMTQRVRGWGLLIAAGLGLWAMPARAWTPGTNISITGGTIAITGQIGVANGGTGVATLTDRAVVIGRGTSAVEAAAPGNAGGALLSTGTGSNPVFGALDLADADARTGTLGLGNGGTNATGFTANRCVRVNAGGTALEAAAGDCATPMNGLLVFGTNGDITQNTTTWMNPGLVDTTEARVQAVMNGTATLNNLKCVSSVLPGASQTYTVTMTDGACTGALSASTNQTCQITNASRICTTATASEGVAAGECFAFKVVSSATAATGVVTCTVERTA